MARPLPAFRAFRLTAKAPHEVGDVLDPPCGCAGAKFNGLGITPSAAAFPPRAFADGNNGQHLGKTKKAECGNVWLTLCHKKAS